MVSTKSFYCSGIAKIFTCDFEILSDSHIQVLFGEVEVSKDLYDIINNSVVFKTAPEQGTILNLIVSTTPDYFEYTGNFQDLLSDYVSKDSLQLTVDDITLQLDEQSELSAGYYKEWDGVSTPKLGQYKFIGLTMYQYLGGSLGELGDGWVRTDASSSGELANYASQVSLAIEDLQNQIDGQVDTWFYEGAPTNTNEPAVNWTTTELKNNHIADLYYDTLTGYGYRYVFENSQWYWIQLQDAGVLQALEAAAAAQDTADHKRTVFYTTATPLNADIGDLWVNSNTKITKTWNGLSWEDITNTNTEQALMWAGYASKLITAPDGAITGWEFADGSNTQSQFTIHSENFKISDGTNSANVPFEVVTGTPNQVKFNGVVEFSNISNVPSGTAQGFYDGIEYDSNEILNENWLKVSGVASPYRSTVRDSGAYGMGVGTDTTNDNAWLVHKNKVAISPDKLYKLSVRARRNNVATGSCYIGLVCYKEDKVTKLNTSGSDSYSSSHYIAASAYQLNEYYTEYVGYFKGQATTGVGGIHSDPNNPAKLYYGTKYVSPMVIANYPNETGRMYFDEIVIEEVGDIPLSLSQLNNDSNFVIPSEVAAAVNNNTTTIDGSRITTGTMNANRINTNYAWVNGSIQSSDFSSIGGAGFRLKSNAAGTSADPTIYGGYIRGGTIEGATITAGNIVSQDIANIDTYRDTTLTAATGTFTVASKSFDVAATSDIIINIDTSYSASIVDNTSNRYTDTLRADLLIDGVVVYSSQGNRLDAVYEDTSGYTYYNTSSMKPVPETHTWVGTLNAGTHSALWRIYQVSGVGDELRLNYSFRSITITKLKK